MASTSSFFSPTSPFITFANQAARGIFVALIRISAEGYHLSINEAIENYFNHHFILKKKIQFKLLLNNYLSGCYDEYLTIHEQILNKTLNESDLNEDNMKHYVYCTVQKIMAQPNGYKHLNCVFDGVRNYCYFQYDYLYMSVLQEKIVITSSGINHGGNLSPAQLAVLRAALDIHMNKINEKCLNLYLNDDKYKNIRFKCEDNNSCELPANTAKQQFKEQEKLIQQEMSHCQCTCDDEH